MVCLNHPNTEAATRCAACGKPLCEECVHESAGKNYCSDSCIERAKDSTARSEDVLTRKNKSNSAAGVRKFIYFVVIIVLAVAVWFIYAKNKKEIDAKVDKSIKAVEKKGNQAIQSGKKAIDKESTYKRDRENLVK